MTSRQPDLTDLWNGPIGRSWVEMQELTDRKLQPFLELLLERLEPGGNEQLLDIGCGTGATTVAFAERLGSGGGCLGIDVSEPMLAAAKERAEKAGLPAAFLHADAEHHAFERGRFDRLVSRFGVMFFAQPARAFANLKLAAASHATLHFVAWRSPEENPFMTTAERRAAPFLPPQPPRPPRAPGQFAFADPDYVQGFLLAAGWHDVTIEPVDRLCVFPKSQLTGFLTRMGALGLALKAAPEELRKQVLDAVLPGFDPYLHGEEVRFTAACWSVSAQA